MPTELAIDAAPYEQPMRTVILRGCQVEALQVGQQEGVPLRIPCPIADIHGV